MAQKRVAVVTGGNKGIGYGIVRNLCKQFDGDVILTARDESRGNEAVRQLQQENPAFKEKGQPKFYQLDLDDESSIQSFRDCLHYAYGGLDVLVNNAAIAYKADSIAPFSEQAENTFRTNFYGTLNVCRALFPLLREHARVVTLSSRAGPITNVLNPDIRQKLTSDKLTISELESVMNDFIKLAKKNDDKVFEGQWKKTAYGVSKTGVTAMTRVLQREIDQQMPNKDILVNSCCPGFINTDMTSHKGPGTIEQGADTPTYLALLTPADKNAPRGQFMAERRVLDWKNGENS